MNKQNFIHFENKIEGKESKYIHAQINIGKIAKYVKEVDGELILDFKIARRKRPVNGKHYIAWTDSQADEQNPLAQFFNFDNTELVESILDNDKENTKK